MAHTSNGRGTLMLARSYPPPVGKLRIASGTKDAQTLTDIYAMLDACARSVPPRYDVLLAIRDRQLHPLFALSLWRQHTLQTMPLGDVAPELAAAIEQWQRKARGSADHARSRRSGLRKLLEHAPPGATLAELPAALRAYRAACELRGTARMFNIVRSYAEAFVRDVLQPTHKVYGEVQAVRTLPYSLNAVTRRPMMPGQLLDELRKLGEAYAADAWQMAVTGMGPREYYETPWHDTGDRVLIEGTKRESRKRAVPWVMAMHAPRVTRSALTQRWRRAKLSLTPYDLRRSYAVWLEEAGIPYSRRERYLGHGARRVTDLYTQRDLSAWLRSDGQALQTWIEQQLSTDNCTDISGVEMQLCNSL